MKTLHSKHLASKKRAEKIIDTINMKYKDSDLKAIDLFRNSEYFTDLTKHREATKKLIYAEVDMKCCKSDNRFMRCDGCICGKN